MELASTRLGLSCVVSAALHAAVAAALLRSVVAASPALLEPAAIQVDLRWVEVASVATAPSLGPTRVASAPPAAVAAAASVSLAASEPLAPRKVPDEQPPAAVPEPEPALRPKNKPSLPAARRPTNRPRAQPPPTSPAASIVAAPSVASGASGSAQVASLSHGSGPPGDGPGSTAPVLGSAIRVRYEQQLYVWLARYKQYPMLARRRGIEGIGSVRVRVDRRGRVLERSLEKSTGERLLDDAAVEMTRRADPFPPVPGDYSGDSFEFVAPIEFRLR